MPGAMYGTVTSISPRSGNVETNEGVFPFRRNSDPMEHNDLTGHFHVGEKVVVVLAFNGGKMRNEPHVDLCCPIRLIKEGTAVVSRIAPAHGIGIDRDGTQAFFNVARLSEYFVPKHIRRADMDLTTVVRVGDKFLYRGVPQVSYPSYKVIEMMLPCHPDYNRMLQQLDQFDKRMIRPSSPPVLQNNSPHVVTPFGNYYNELSPPTRSFLKRENVDTSDYTNAKRRQFDSDILIPSDGHFDGRRTVSSSEYSVEPDELKAAKQLAKLMFEDVELNKFLLTNNRMHIIRKALDVLEAK